MSDQSEEKTLPASEHKLQKAREKGQVSASADFVSSVVVVISLLFVGFNWTSLVNIIAQLYNTSINHIAIVTPSLAFKLLIHTFESISSTLSWLGMIIVIAAICANIIHKKGIPFSLEPIKPDFTKINPAQGFKKLFSVRNTTEFAVSLFKIVFWFIASGLVLYLALDGFMRSVTCGGPCVLEQAIETATYITIIAVLMLIITGMMDLPMQDALFQRDQKMGHSEAKRERKDTQGNQEFKNHRRSQYNEMLSDGGSNDATFYLAGPGFMVGISFDQSVSPVPRVISRVREAGYESAEKKAKTKKIPIMREPDLAADIFRTIDVGNVIRERHFERVAAILVKLDLLK